MKDQTKRRRTGALIALALLAVSVIAATVAMGDATAALACCGGGGW